MKKTALIIMFITIASKIIGFGREIVLSYFYGATSISDAYLVAITIPGVIFSFIVTGINAGYIPLLSNIIQKENLDESNKFTSNLISLLFAISTVVVVLGLIYTEPLVKLFAIGFNGETLTLAINLTRVSLFAVYFSALVSVLSGYLQVYGNYIIPALVGFPLNIVTIFSIFISQYLGVTILVFGYVIAIASQVIFMIPFVRRYKLNYRLMLNLNDEYLTNLIKIIMPLILSVSVNQINILVDRTIASKLGAGGISALNFASKLNNFVQGIFVVSIVTALYPVISKLAAEKNIKGLKKYLSESITGINLLVIPATVGSVIFAEPIVRTLYGRGAFNEDAIVLTSSALLFYSIGMIGFGLRDILTRAFYSLQDTKTPMINGVIGVLINIALNIVLSKYLGIGGLALATSVSAIVTTFMLFISLRNRIGSLGLKSIIKSFFKISLASIIMGVFSYKIYVSMSNYLDHSISLIISIFIGGILYFGLIYSMKVDDIEMLIKHLIKKMRMKINKP